MKKAFKVLLVVAALVLCLSASACAAKKPSGSYGSDGIKMTFNGSNVSSEISASLFGINLSAGLQKGTFKMEDKVIAITWEGADEGVVDRDYSYDAANDQVVYKGKTILAKVA